MSFFVMSSNEALINTSKLLRVFEIYLDMMIYVLLCFFGGVLSLNLISLSRRAFELFVVCVTMKKLVL